MKIKKIYRIYSRAAGAKDWVVRWENTNDFRWARNFIRQRKEWSGREWKIVAFAPVKEYK